VPDRSPESYAREIASLSQRLSEECANSLRLAREAERLRERWDLAHRAVLLAGGSVLEGYRVGLRKLEARDRSEDANVA
jgi:hypothetical protein